MIECLAIMREILQEQRARVRHLDVKAASLAGFCATALTLNLTLGRPLLGEHFAGPAHAWVRDFFLGSTVMLAASALVAVIGVLRPLKTEDLDDEAIDSYADQPKVKAVPAELREKWLQSLGKMALADRQQGTSKATWSSVAAVLLALGIVGLMGQAFTLGIAT